MQSFVVLMNILKPLLPGQHQWLEMFPGMFFIFGIMEEGMVQSCGTGGGKWR